MTDKNMAQFTLMIADKNINRLMARFDLCPEYKVFVTAKQMVSFKTDKMVNAAYIHNIIEKSREEKDYWIPAIECCGEMFVAKEIIELSDGNHVMFVRK